MHPNMHERRQDAKKQGKKREKSTMLAIRGLVCGLAFFIFYLTLFNARVIILKYYFALARKSTYA